ncbi:hypothetical protein Rhopal_004859-T1 [Rhodotorula paludigena]|uniref:Proteophosphoglycan ppg4 n=1 Tax=Rhodotorula paludigena TaxID=86838 RepID=A0AAV5GGY4_9BASI|nr:hypothetical protein Rhopal_004859-T1 [Rhodotorula paludigena]
MQPAHRSLDDLSSLLNTILSHSTRLSALHPNDLSTPNLALTLRDALLAAADLLRRCDADIWTLWGEEERVRLACRRGVFRLRERDTRAVGSEAGELDERREEVDGLVRRLERRVKMVRREARGEKKDRRRRERRGEGAGANEPERLGDYLVPGTRIFPHLLMKDTVELSRWVVENPFSILSGLLDDLKSLTIPHAVKADASPATFRPRTAPPLYPASHLPPDVHTDGSSLWHIAPRDNPTPAGVTNSGRRMPDWKAAILREAKQRSGRVGWSHRLFDEIAADGREGIREVEASLSRGHRERWIIIAILALLPILIVANLLEDLFASRRDSSTTSSASASATSFASSLGYRTIEPTMLKGEEKGALATGVAMQAADETLLRERRRRSAELDAELV